MAAHTDLSAAEINPSLNLKTNVIGFARTLESLVEQDNSVFVVNVGTATQIGFTDSHIATNEDHVDAPVSVYDIGKLTTELLLLHYVAAGKLNGCSLRLTNVFGRGSSSQVASRGVIDKIMARALEGEDITLMVNPALMRDYVHVSDVADAIYAVCESQKAANGQKFIVGSGVGTSIGDAFDTVVRAAQELSGCKSRVKCDDRSEDLHLIDRRSFVADVSALTTATGWVPKLTLHDGLMRSYRGYQTPEKTTVPK